LLPDGEKAGVIDRRCGRPIRMRSSIAPEELYGVHVQADVARVLLDVPSNDTRRIFPEDGGTACMLKCIECPSEGTIVNAP
jgi:hypothetical protein